MRYLFILAFSIVGLLGLSYGQSYAQATRTWVSGVGDDANPCSRTAPCKTFAGAISKTAASGEINVLDPGGFGAVTITKSITIRSDHIQAGVLVSGTNGIIVNAGAADRIVLEGLDIEGLGTGLNGVSVVAGLSVTIVRCTIHHFSQNGVNMASMTSGARVVISDSFINFNNGGVNIQGSGTSNSAAIVGSTIDSNVAFGIQANGVGNSIGIVNSIVTASPTGVSVLNGASVTSFGPSNVLGGGGVVTSTVQFK